MLCKASPDPSPPATTGHDAHAVDQRDVVPPRPWRSLIFDAKIWRMPDALCRSMAAAEYEQVVFRLPMLIAGVIHFHSLTSNSAVQIFQT